MWLMTAICWFPHHPAAYPLLMTGIIESFTGKLAYTSGAPDRFGAERGRESFRIDVHRDGCKVVSAHCEIDDPPPVVRDVSLRIDPQGRPADCFVRIAVGGAFRGSAWFTFDSAQAECEAQTLMEGRVSQKMPLQRPLPGFGNHAIINDGMLLSQYDLTQGPGTQIVEKLLLSSPDHRGATGPLLFAVDLAIQYHGPETIETAAGRFDAHKFSYTDVPGLLQAHPPYDLWCTADGHYILLKAEVGGYMQTRYELVQLCHLKHAAA
ncbi:hypothetical protein HNE_1455 [Hyphomonas neptunium ATCC 15444]|uniref:DUF3108 domain-containing protein n=2 Tax=Hyphomonas TaxID=85 RepID=Q0C273_HYPNA|nr:hypothetical protein HNE_1455 [Hyphomonas neptunium ATCC 15444]